MGVSLATMVTRVRVRAGNPPPTTGAGDPPDAMADSKIQEQIEHFVRNELTRFYPKFSLNNITPDGGRNYSLAAVTNLREVRAVFPRSVLSTSFGNVFDVIFSLVSGGNLDIIGQPSLWMVSWRDIGQVRRVAQPHRFVFDPDNKILYLGFDPGTDPVTYLALITRQADDAGLQSLPSDVDELVEKGAAAKIMNIRAAMLSQLGGRQRSGGFIDYGAGGEYLKLAEKVEKEVYAELSTLDKRVLAGSVAVPVTLGL